MIFQHLDDEEQLEDLVQDLGLVESPEVLEILTNISGLLLAPWLWQCTDMCCRGQGEEVVGGGPHQA